jgi:HAD superfamily hydrolase (TIGR01509 family)
MLNEKEMNNIKALFFDFDGTLVDSLPVLKKVYLSFLEKMGYQGSEEEFQHLNGPNINQIIDYLKKKYRLTDSPESIKEMFHQLFKGIYSRQVHFFPGATDFLAWAKKNRFRLFIVTSAEPIMVSLVLEKKQVQSLFEAIISSKDSSNGKPHPEVYLRALNQADVNPEEVLAFEDSMNGLLSARGAGIQTVEFGKDFADWHEILNEFRRLVHE